MGGYSVSVDADLMRVATHGVFSIAEAEQLFTQIALVLREHGAVYVLVDVSDGMSMDSALRRRVAQLAHISAPTAVAIFGATLPQQAMLILLNSAVQIVRGRRVPLRFSRSETEARAWLLSQRPGPNK